MSHPAARGPRYRQLPLWRDAQRFLLEVELAVRAFPRYHKYTLGSDLRRQAMDVPWLERLYEPVFIHDSYANRKGKGTHAAVQRLQTFTRSQRGGHYLQLDIANFFHSVDRRTLYGLLQARVQRDLRQSAFATGQGVQGSFAAKAAPTAAGTVSRVGAASAANTPHAQTTPRPRHVHPGEARHMLWLARLLLTGNPAQGAVYQGRPQDLARVPAHKQLANAPDGKGLPIGNLTSQFFANVYLNELDQYIKHTLKVRHYLRYVDDFVLLHHNPAQLRQWREAIEGFLRQRLGLALRDARRLAPVAHGIDFLGYIVRPGYLLVRQRVLGHLHDKLTRMGRRVQHANGSLRCPPALAAQVQAVLASYFGHLAHAKSRNAQAQVFARHPWQAVPPAAPVCRPRTPCPPRGCPRCAASSCAQASPGWKWPKAATCAMAASAARCKPCGAARKTRCHAPPPSNDNARQCPLFLTCKRTRPP